MRTAIEPPYQKTLQVTWNPCGSRRSGLPAKRLRRATSCLAVDPSAARALALAAPGAGRLPAADLRRDLGRQPGKLALPHLLHHLRHLLAGGEELVHLLDRRAAPLRDPRASRAVDQVRYAPLLQRHREHDRLDARHLALVD